MSKDISEQTSQNKETQIVPGTTLLIFIPCIGTPSRTAKAPRICKRRDQSELSWELKRLLVTTTHRKVPPTHLLHRCRLWDANYGHGIGNFVLHRCTAIILILSRKFSLKTSAVSIKMLLNANISHKRVLAKRT